MLLKQSVKFEMNTNLHLRAMDSASILVLCINSEAMESLKRFLCSAKGNAVFFPCIPDRFRSKYEGPESCSDSNSQHPVPEADCSDDDINAP